MSTEQTPSKGDTRAFLKSLRNDKAARARDEIKNKTFALIVKTGIDAGYDVKEDELRKFAEVASLCSGPWNGDG
jgi:hypothetical protein